MEDPNSHLSYPPITSITWKSKFIQKVSAVVVNSYVAKQAGNNNQLDLIESMDYLKAKIMQSESKSDTSYKRKAKRDDEVEDQSQK